MPYNFISVIVPAHNEQKYISQCLKSLIAQDYSKDRYEIIVVDNDSRDRTQEIVKKLNVRIIEQNTGPVGAVRNAGAAQAKGDFLAFIDADCVAPDNWLTKGSQLLQEDFTAYGGGYDLRKSPFWLERAWLLENREPPKDLLGGSIFIRKKDFISVGSFDETITSGEDTKLSNSLRANKYKVIMKEELNVIHLGNPTNIKTFFLRQVWHSENYLNNWKDTRIDPTFYLLIIFMIGLITFSLSAIILNKTGLVVAALIIAIMPFIFTVKRLRRSRNIRKNLRNFPAIYILDFTYLCARVIGLSKSAFKSLKKITLPQNQRVD
tara:strand:- start:5720 stop:6682 length:963 start_codon:yes stop_codon:yes gene_type:complete